MNEIERDYIAAKLFGLEVVALVLKLLVVVMCGFIGLWLLGVVIMFWWAAVPIAAVVVWQASRSVSASCVGPSSEDAPRSHGHQRPTPPPTPSAR